MTGDNRPHWISRRHRERSFAVGDTDAAIPWAGMPPEIAKVGMAALPRLLAAGFPRAARVGRARYWRASQVAAWAAEHRQFLKALAAESAS